MKKCCFTGRRPKDLCGYDHNNYKTFTKDLVNTLEDLYNEGVRTFITGGAQGFDQLAFWAVEILKKQHNDIENVVYVPFKGQEKCWKEEGAFSQTEYRRMLKKADCVEYLVNKELTEYKDVAKALTDRNKVMVDKSDFVVALYPDMSYKENTGGTAHCMRYADEQNKPIRQIEYEITNNKLVFGKIRDLKKPAPKMSIKQTEQRVAAEKDTLENTAKSFKVQFKGEFANNFRKGDIAEIKYLEKGTYDEELHPNSEGNYLVCVGNVGLVEWDSDIIAEMIPHVEILDDPYGLTKPLMEIAPKGVFHLKYEDRPDNEFLEHHRDYKDKLELDKLKDIAIMAKTHSDPDVNALVPYLEELIRWREFGERLPEAIKELNYDGIIPGKAWFSGRYDGTETLQKTPDMEFLYRQTVLERIKEVKEEVMNKMTAPKAEKKPESKDDGWVNIAETIFDEIPHEDFDLDFNEPEMN